MAYQNKSVIVDEAEVQAVKAAVATIKAKLLFLARLTADERKPCLKSQASQLGSRQNRGPLAPGPAGRLPKTFAEAECEQEVDLVAVLIEFVGAVEEMISEVDHARLTFKPEQRREPDAGKLMQAAQRLEQAAPRFDGTPPPEQEKILPEEPPHPDSNN